MGLAQTAQRIISLGIVLLGLWDGRDLDEVFTPSQALPGRKSCKKPSPNGEALSRKSFHELDHGFGSDSFWVNK